MFYDFMWKKGFAPEDGGGGGGLAPPCPPFSGLVGRSVGTLMSYFR